MTTSKRPKPKHGTVTEYRRGCRCDRCRSANTRARRLERARKAQRGENPPLTLVGDTPSSPQPDPTSTPHDEEAKPPQPRLWIGPVEQAVTDDIDELNSEVPMHRTLRAMAIALAKEIDDMDGKGSKAALHNQLLDVVTKLRGDSDGEDESDDALFAALSQPLVPGTA